MTTRELNPELKKAIEEGGGGSTVLLGATKPTGEIKDNSIWFRTGVGDSEIGTIPGEGGNPDIYDGVMVKNAVLDDDEPEHEVTTKMPFWFKDLT